MELRSNELSQDNAEQKEDDVAAELIREGKIFECTQDYSIFVKKGDKIEIVKKTKKDTRYRILNKNGIKGDIEYTLRRGGEDEFKNSFIETENRQGDIEIAQERIDEFNERGDINLAKIQEAKGVTKKDISEVTEEERKFVAEATDAKLQLEKSSKTPETAPIGGDNRETFDLVHNKYKDKNFGLEGDDRIWRIKNASKGRFKLENFNDKTTKTIGAEDLDISIKNYDLGFLRKQKDKILNFKGLSEKERIEKLSVIDKEISEKNQDNLFSIREDLQKIGEILGAAHVPDMDKKPEEFQNLDEKIEFLKNQYIIAKSSKDPQYRLIANQIKMNLEKHGADIGPENKEKKLESLKKEYDIANSSGDPESIARAKNLNMEIEGLKAQIELDSKPASEPEKITDLSGFDTEKIAEEHDKELESKMEPFVERELGKLLYESNLEEMESVEDLSKQAANIYGIFKDLDLENEKNVMLKIIESLETDTDRLAEAKADADNLPSNFVKTTINKLIEKCENTMRNKPISKGEQTIEEEEKWNHFNDEYRNKIKIWKSIAIDPTSILNAKDLAIQNIDELEHGLKIDDLKAFQIEPNQENFQKAKKILATMSQEALDEYEKRKNKETIIEKDEVLNELRRKIEGLSEGDFDKLRLYVYGHTDKQMIGDIFSKDYFNALTQGEIDFEKIKTLTIKEIKGIVESVYKTDRQGGLVYGIKIKTPGELQRMSEEDLKAENANALNKLNELKQNMDFVWIEKTPEYDQLLKYSSLLDSSYRDKIKQTTKEIIKPTILEKNDLDKLNLADAENVLQQTSDYLNFIKTHKTQENWFSKEFNDFGLYEQKLVTRINELKAGIVDQAFQNAINAVNGELPLTQEEIQSVQRMEEEALARGFDLSDNEEYQRLKARLNAPNSTTSSASSSQHILRSEELKKKYDELQIEQDNQRSVVMDELSAMPMNDKELANKQRIGGQINEEEIKKIQKTLTLRDFRNSLTLDKLATESAKTSQIENVKDRIEGHRAVDAELINMRNALLNELLAIKTENERVKLSKERKKAAGNFMSATKIGIWDSIKNIGSVRNNEEAMALFHTGNQVTVKRNSGEMETDWTVDRVEGDQVFVSQIRNGRKVASKKVQWGELKSYNNFADVENRVAAPSGRQAVSRSPIEPGNIEQNIEEGDQSSATTRTAESVNPTEQESEAQRTSFFDKFKFWKSKAEKDETENSEKLFEDINKLTKDLKTNDLSNENQFDSALSNLQTILEKVSKKHKLSPELKDSFKNIREIDFSEYLKQLKSADGFDYDQIKEYIEEDKEAINELPENAKILKDAMNNLLDKYQKLFELSLNRSQTTSEADDLLEKRFPLSPSKLKREIKGLRKEERLKLKKILTKYSDPNEITEKDITVEDFFVDETNFNKNIGDPLNLKFEETKKRKLIELAAHIKKIFDEIEGS